MSNFVIHVTRDLALKIAPPNTPPSSPGYSQRTGADLESLRSLLLSISRPVPFEHTGECLRSVQRLESNRDSFTGPDDEETTLRRAIVGHLTVNIYRGALDAFLKEARQIEDEIEWWNDVECSSSNVIHYFIQTLPLRLASLGDTILAKFRRHNLPLRPSIFTPSSLRQLFPSTSVLRPSSLTVALFPYLRSQPYSIALLTGRFPSVSAFADSPRQSVVSALHAVYFTFVNLAHGLVRIVSLPLELTRGECNYKRDQLKKMRDERAETLGLLAEMRDSLASTLEDLSNEAGMEKLKVFAYSLYRVIQGKHPFPIDNLENLSTVTFLQFVAEELHPSDISMRTPEIATRNLARPSRFTLLWPRLLLLPPLMLYALRCVYASRWSLHEVAVEAWQTARGFWEGWLLEPLREVVKTVRTGGDDTVIVNQQSLRADLDSLERMALALAQEKLNYNATQIEALSRQIQLGDLTPVMQIYEEDIKNPLKSAVGGTLLRTLFIQVQKAKVDIDQALAGIDKLLKSQELTFAFVGVAPAIAIVYVLGGYVRAIWAGGRGRGRYGGSRRKASVWLKMRRIERLLIAQPKSDHDHRHPGAPLAQPAPSIPPLTAGLLLLSVSHLRTYAERYLPANTRLREGFLEDVVDLEDPALGRAEKLRVLDRMWRSWGEVLEWNKAANIGR
ncbi:uncharacterized protein FIBRA_05699 [Fibroporia radiculosa]|uniref:NCA2-domain-containing protein n=1 Tax=Fibroporia radiculosa TaxID=599839 RepID=J4G9Y5_9APHY|nr:uncharacterized protein FIBRA_05699 [Fibroporia radiculosa]CCM03563.1 predicted protein [Fibroporia radiculosa]